LLVMGYSEITGLLTNLSTEFVHNLKKAFAAAGLASNVAVNPPHEPVDYYIGQIA